VLGSVLLKAPGIVVPLAVSTLTATQSWMGPNYILWNGPLWSVSTVMFFYWRFPYLMPRLRKWQRRRQATRLLALLMWLKFLSGHFVPGQYMQVRSDPTLTLGMFLIGALAGLSRSEAPAPDAMLQAQWARYTDRFSFALLCWLVLAGVFAASSGAAAQLSAAKLSARITIESLIALPFTYWLEAVTMGGNRSCTARFLNTVVLQRVGDWSYAVYCLQFPVWSWCFSLIGHGDSWGPHAFGPGEMLIVMAVLVLVACLSTVFVERPAQRWIQRRFCVPVPMGVNGEAPTRQLESQLTTFEMTLPPGTEPGAMLQFIVPHTGQAIQFEVPGHAMPGAVITVQAQLPVVGAPPASTTCEQWSPESGRCLCMDPDADGELSLWLCLALSGMCCIPRRECCCCNPCNPRAGCGNGCADWRVADLSEVHGMELQSPIVHVGVQAQDVMLQPLQQRS